MKKNILDENVPHALMQALVGPSVTTVQDQGWTGIENGELLALLDDKFDVFITADKNLRYQQNLAQRKVAIIELPFNARRKVLPLGREILKAVESARVNDYIQI